MRRALIMPVVILVACTRPPVSLDDESVDEGSSSEESAGEESAEGSSTTSSDDESTFGDSFITFQDMTNLALCDPFMQDCPQGEKCVPYSSDGDSSWDANKCVPVLGDQQPGEPCTSAGFVEATDDCDETSVCWNAVEIDGELVGTCAAFCTGTADDPECPEGSSCPIADDGSIALCIPECDPLLPDCPDGQGCYWLVGIFLCELTTSNIPTGEPCGYINDCAPGNLCADAGVVPECAGAACCVNFCNLALGDSQCAILPGTACVPFFEMGQVPPGDEDIGICVLP